MRRRNLRGEVNAVIEGIAAEIAGLPMPSLRALAPVLAQAEAELARDLARWLRSVPDGETRYTAQRHRQALVQLRAAMRAMRGLSPALYDALEQANASAGPLALGHLARQVERFSLMFEGSIRPLPIQPAAVLAKGDRLLLRHYKRSAAAYGDWAVNEIQRQLAVGMVRGETFAEMTRRLQRLSPTARNVAGMVKATGEVADDVARALTQRIRSRAELIVRTEAINAYNAHALDALREAEAEDPDYLGRWDATLDRRGCELCRNLDGVTRGVGKEFPGGVKHPPRHPRCRCVLTPWHRAWGDSPGATGATTVAAPAPPPMPAGFKYSEIDGEPPRGLARGLPSMTGIDQGKLYVVKLSDLERAGLYEFGWDPSNRNDEEGVDAIRQFWAEGGKLPPIRLEMDSEGRLYVEDGRHRLRAAMDEGGDRLMLVRLEPHSGDVRRTGVENKRIDRAAERR